MTVAVLVAEHDAGCWTLPVGVPLIVNCSPGTVPLVEFLQLTCTTMSSRPTAAPAFDPNADREPEEEATIGTSTLPEFIVAQADGLEAAFQRMFCGFMTPPED